MDPFESEVDLVGHLSLCHTGPFPFECKQCNKHFKTKNGQSLHTSNSHPKKNPRRRSAGKVNSVEPIKLSIQEEGGEKIFQVLNNNCRLN
jgi:hypothetical protein